MGARQHIFQRPWSPYVEVYWAQNHSGIEAYVTPVSQNKIEIAFLWYQHQLAAGPQLFLKLIEHFPELREKIDLNLLANDFKAYGPFGSTHHQFNFKNISFLGDAFGFFDGITGEGLSMGMSVSQKVVTDFIPGKKLKWKTQLMIKIEYGKYIALTQIALFFSRHQTLRKMVFKFLRQRPLLFNQLLRWNDQKIFSHSSS
jgi:flavin-dependent dehydrogenase